jgi:3-oxoacyl-[acyl-carrier protein] reductase
MRVVNYKTSADKAKAVVTGIESKGGQAVAMQADMSDVADARRLVRETVQRFGRLDILVNNAAISLSKPLIETTEQEFDQLFALNARGPYFAMQEAAKVIQDGGRIVNISSGGHAPRHARRDCLSQNEGGARAIHQRAGA